MTYFERVFKLKYLKCVLQNVWRQHKQSVYKCKIQFSCLRRFHYSVFSFQQVTFLWRENAPALQIYNLGVNVIIFAKGSSILLQNFFVVLDVAFCGFCCIEL